MNKIVARMAVEEPIPGVCDNSNVFIILPIPGNGQENAVCSKTEEQILSDLKSKLTYLNDKPNYTDSTSLTLIINCEGDLVQNKIGVASQSPELDQQILSVFEGLKKWVPGKIRGKKVDTVELIKVKIINGILSLS